MKKILFLLFPLFVQAQTTQLNFTYKNGQTVGRSIVMDLPVTLFDYWVPQGQLLVFYPPAYYQGKVCGFMLFNAGDGEQIGLDVTLVNKNSLPYMISKGLTPYSILPNKDTLWWVVASIHNNAGSAYRSQLKQIIPWILDKSGIKYDPHHVGVSGLSGGGSATWASVMTDTAVAARITWIASLANGGYDDKLPALKNNLIYWLQHGGHAYPYIGTQDPGYNGPGFFAYDTVCRKYALPDCYHPHIIFNGTHSANVWDVPWNSRTIWDSLGAIGYTATTPPAAPRVKAYIYTDSTTIHYPTSWVTLIDTSINAGGGGSWDIIDYPPGPPPIISTIDFHHAYYFGLRPGVYTIGIHVYGLSGNTTTTINNADHTQTTTTDFNNMDSATVKVTVIGPPSRYVTGMTYINNVLTFVYSDGKP